ncbi:putative proton-dependent oligopeptide transporter family, MFS transporter superfamily [Helianthus annuus]|nr:putative proton-dependent oligopeptide transporter family, MFS transporter superfamily [Helianthus annuus]KAJ0621768.1 putative proton-dependent oligopeptide transporter family, MFS transporter superfamily [Helianthus annuus]KAJ0956128.1 putative proton-dependent oligopeptide transporter family, major facilitator superfamily [Helianthus annuus]
MSPKKEDENGETNYEDTDNKKALGGIKTMPFILANEVCDRFAGTGFHANLITYLTQQLNLPMVKASNILTNFGGTLSFMPLIGALVADSFAGRFYTIVVGLLVYLLGMVCITTSSILPQFRPPPCPTKENCIEASSSQLWVLYLCLLLTSLGSGAIRPNVVTFAADQFDMSTGKSNPSSVGRNFFNWYYFCMGLATLMALTVVVYIQDHAGWGLGLGIPTIAMVLSFIAFVVAAHLYRRVKPEGSPLVRVAQVVVASFKKRKLVVPGDTTLLYENKKLDARISVDGRLLHTNTLKWFDRAAIVTQDDMKDSTSPNLWRLATVHRVEEIKSVIRMVPIWSAAILFVTSQSHQHSFIIIQAGTMDRHMSPSFEIPPASLSIFSVLTMLICLSAYKRFFVPFARRFTNNPIGITSLQRMGIGHAINILATLVSALVEIKRKQIASAHNLIDDPKAIIPISVFWLVPQFCLHGIAEAFMSVGHLEFLYDQSPESMRSTCMALNWITVSIGSYVGTFVVSMIHDHTGKEHNWLPDRNLNKGKLDYYYWLMSGIQAVNLVYYVTCAYLYTCKPLELVKDIDTNGDLELATEKTSVSNSLLNGQNRGSEKNEDQRV